MRFLLLTALIALFAAGCANGGNKDVRVENKVRNPQQRLASWWQKVRDEKTLLKNGDLVTRTGNDMISAALCNFNKQDKTYSHSGLAFIENGEVYVYHTMAGDENPSNKMMREKFDSFCNPSRKNGFGIFRYDLTSAENNSLHAFVQDMYKNEMPFDTKFDLQDDTAMYCAELIYKGLKQSTHNRLLLPTTVQKNFRFKQAGYRNQVFTKLEYVAIDNLYINPYCKEIARVKFD